MASEQPPPALVHPPATPAAPGGANPAALSRRIPPPVLFPCIIIALLLAAVLALLGARSILLSLVLLSLALLTTFLFFLCHRRLHSLHRLAQAHEARTRLILQLAIDALPNPTAFLSPDGRIEIANAPAQAFFSLTPGLTIQQLPRPWLTRLLQAVTKTHTRVEASGHEAAIQIFHQGREYFFLPRAIPLILPPASTLAGIILMLIDTTDLRHIDEAKSSLLSSLSHELKTPLTSLQMSIHLLLEDAAPRLTPRHLDLLEAARDDANRLNALIATLLATPPP